MDIRDGIRLHVYLKNHAVTMEDFLSQYEPGPYYGVPADQIVVEPREENLGFSYSLAMDTLIEMAAHRI